jgi:mRNA interferase RelE/StbE
LAWNIEFNDSAARQLARLGNPIAKRVVTYLNTRVAPLADPRSLGEPLTGSFEHLWRYRVGDYRIVCAVEADIFRVLVVRVGHRRDVYRRP